ncbi:MAG: ATP-binding protein [Kofleriaceae bacterium]
MTAENSRPLVLYVDDERANRIVLEHSLKSDFNIVVVESGEKAIATFEEREVAVLVTDMRMPGMGGDQLLRIVKDRWPTTIRMVMTAHQDIGPILRAINEGLVARYIIKPFERPELVQLLRWACEAWAFGKDSQALHHRLMETERLATLGSIAGLLVHDLRQPLMSQLVNIEHVGELAKDADAITSAVQGSSLPTDVKTRAIAILGDLEGVVTDLKQSTMHLNEMISGLRDLGRPRAAVKATPSVDPLPIIRHAMAVCQEVALKARASISYTGENKLPLVLMNQTELMQVLINVVANAAQAVAARGELDGSVQISARTSSQMLELEIRDNGVGMEPETLAKVGTPFFTTREDGTGLGIAQCQRLVGNVGGRFALASKRGEGTTVMITIPIAR